MNVNLSPEEAFILCRNSVNFLQKVIAKAENIVPNDCSNVLEVVASVYAKKYFPNKIAAIKEHREFSRHLNGTLIGLAESKNMIEKFWGK